MVHRTLLVITTALLALGSSGQTRAGETLSEIVEQVTALRKARRFADAAKLADDSARRDELGVPARVLLGGLARQNYELSFEAGGPLTDLCKTAEILRLVAPLDAPEAGKAKLKAAEDAEKRLEHALGPTWRAACTPAAGSADTASVTAASVPEENAAPTSTRPEAPPPQLPRPTLETRHDRRRLRIGVGMLVPGLALMAPMAGLLAYRAAGERELGALRHETMGRASTEAEDAAAAALGQRYAGTTAGAIVLGLTGGALVVTGAVFLATGTRERRVAVAPWGTRGLGGLVIHGRF